MFGFIPESIGEDAGYLSEAEVLDFLMGEMLLAENVKLYRRKVPEVTLGKPKVISAYRPETQII